MIDIKNEVKTSIEGLRIGMFVSRLDRPWIQTPFAIEGIEIMNEEDIEQIGRYCNFVFVDIDIGLSPDPRYWVLKEENAPRATTKYVSQNSSKPEKRQTPDEYTKLRKKTYEDKTTFSTESKMAEKVLNNVQADFGRLISNIKRGKELDANIVKEGVSAMVESIIRNPSAMMWVTQVRKLDEYTYSRALGTSVWCATFGRHLGLDKVEIENLALGGLLLDVGKSRIPLSLLKKTGSLNGTEMQLMRKHVDLGVRLLSKTTKLSVREKLPLDVLQMIATHHEKSNGSGYPQGLNNTEIPVFGRIVGIVDTYDAITSERPYAAGVAPRTPHEAIGELYEMRGTVFQSELVEQFIQTVGLYPTGSLVELSTGEVGVVVATNGLRRLRPSVMLLLDGDKNPLPDFRHVDLSQPEVHATVKEGLHAGAYGIDMKELFL